VTFRRLTGVELQIKIVETKTAPLSYVLRESPLTSSLIFLTLERAYSVFGCKTFIEKTGHHLVSISYNQNMLNVMQGWKTMGFEITPLDFLDQPSPIFSHPTCGKLQGTRRIGDNKSWTIPLNTTDVMPSPRPYYVIDYASFNITTTFAFHGTLGSYMFNHYVLQFKLLADQSLQHQYVVPSAQYDIMKRHFQDHTTVGEQLAGWVPAVDSGWKYSSRSKVLNRASLSHHPNFKTP
jgi:hypothetical protein